MPVRPRFKEAIKSVEHRTIRLELLPGDLQPELVESVEHCQVGTGELGKAVASGTSRSFG
jgi:hypothetical protein